MNITTIVNVIIWRWLLPTELIAAGDSHSICDAAIKAAYCVISAEKVVAGARELEFWMTVVTSEIPISVAWKATRIEGSILSVVAASTVDHLLITHRRTIRATFI